MIFEYLSTVISIFLVFIIRGIAWYFHPFEELKHMNWANIIFGIVSLKGVDIAIFSFYIISAVILAFSLFLIFLRRPARISRNKMSNLITRYNYYEEIKALEEAFADDRRNNRITKDMPNTELDYTNMINSL